MVYNKLENNFEEDNWSITIDSLRNTDLKISDCIYCFRCPLWLEDIVLPPLYSLQLKSVVAVCELSLWYSMLRKTPTFWWPRTTKAYYLLMLATLSAVAPSQVSKSFQNQGWWISSCVGYADLMTEKQQWRKPVMSPKASA